MGLFDSKGLDLFSPDGMALLGALEALGQAAMPSPTPVPMGAAFGSMAGGLARGAKSGREMQQAALLAELNKAKTLQAQREAEILKEALGIDIMAPAAPSGGGAAPSAAPFGFGLPDPRQPAASGAGAAPPIAGAPRPAAGSSGDAWLNQNAPFRTLANPAGQPIRWTDKAPDTAALASDPSSYGPGSPFGRAPPSGATPSRLAQAGPTPPPGAPSATMQPPAFGSPVPMGEPAVDPQALAKKQYLLGLIGKGNALSGYSDFYYRSPGYLARAEAARAAARVPSAYAMPDANATLQGLIAGSRAAGEAPTKAALDRFNAQLKAWEANNRPETLSPGQRTYTGSGRGAPPPLSPYDATPAIAPTQEPLRLAPGGTVPGTVPPPQAMQSTTPQAGEPIVLEGRNYGAVPENYRAVETPDGNVRFEPIPGSAAARGLQGKDAAKRQSADIVTHDIDRALQLSGRWTTGALGSLTQPIPGAPAYDLRSLLDTIKANVGFERLQQMRESSPTGGALGQVSERENILLQSTLGNLDQSQSREQFEQNLRRLRGIYAEIVDGFPGAEKLTPEQRAKVIADRYPAAASANGGGAAQSSAAPAPPKIGDVRDGYKFRGGNPADPASWLRSQ